MEATTDLIQLVAASKQLSERGLCAAAGLKHSQLSVSKRRAHATPDVVVRLCKVGELDAYPWLALSAAEEVTDPSLRARAVAAARAALRKARNL